MNQISEILNSIAIINTELENRVKLHSLTAIPNNSDLNNYLTVGNYCCGSNANAATITNSPTTSAFCLYITNGVGATVTTAPTTVGYSYFLQRVVTLEGKEYVRKVSFNNSTTPTFANWTTVV